MMSYQYDNVLFSTRDEAEKTLDTLLEVLDTYGSVTVSDLYELIGATPDYIDSRYGWIDLSGAEIIRIKRGYSIYFRKGPHLLETDAFTRYFEKPKSEPNVSVDILVTINGKKYKLVPVDDK